MRRMWCRRVVVPAVLGMLLVTAACQKKETQPLSQGPGGGGPTGGGGGGGASPIGQAMNKIGKGPQSLNALIAQELKEDAPPWDKIEPQAKEYAELSATLSKYDPPKGDKESWTKQADSFAKTADSLHKAAEKKDKDGATQAQASLNKSCMGCHNEHRGGPGMRGGRGGFGPPGGGRPGGPPAGKPQ